MQPSGWTQILVGAGISLVSWLAPSLPIVPPEWQLVLRSVGFVLGIVLIVVPLAIHKYRQLSGGAISALTPAASTPAAAEEPTTPRVIVVGGRTVVNVTPEYLTGLFEGHTVVQGEKLIEAYIGKWMKVSGRVGDIHPNQVTFERANPFSRYFVVFMYPSALWLEQLSVLRISDTITVIGRIERVNRIEVHLRDCEPVNP